MKIQRSFVFCATLCALAGGCGGDPGQLDPASEGTSTDDLWSSHPGDIWPQANVAVCFTAKARSYSQYSTWATQFRNIIETQYANRTSLRFVFWGACPTTTDTPNFINVNFTYGGGQTRPQGGQTYELDVDPDSSVTIQEDPNAPAVCAGYGGTWPNCPLWTSSFTQRALHEMGHALTFNHEFSRPDYTQPCGTQTIHTGTLGSTFGTSPDPASIMNSTYCQLNAVLSATDVQGIANAYGSSAAQLIGSRARQFASGGGVVYGLSLDGQAIYKYNGTGGTANWTLVGNFVGNAVSSIYAGGSNLYALDATAHLQKWLGGTSWQVIGNPANSFVANTDGSVYALASDKGSIYKYLGSGGPGNWTFIGGAAAKMYAGGGRFFATNPNDGALYEWLGGTASNWTLVSLTAAKFVVDSNHNLYKLTTARDAVYKYTGSGVNGWTLIGGAAADLWSGAAGVYASDPKAGWGQYQLYKYNGTGTSWTKTNGKVLDVVASTNGTTTMLAAVDRFSSALYRYLSP